MAEDVKRTTVRMPAELHGRLKRAAANSGTTLEEMINRAVEHELASNGDHVNENASRDFYNSVWHAMEDFRKRSNIPLHAPDPAEDPAVWSPRLAYRYLQYLPTLAVIKDDQGRIIWCNKTYEATFGRSLSQMQGRPISKLGFVGEDHLQKIHVGMRDVLADGTARETIETVQAPGRDLLLRVQRFLLIHPRTEERLIGDISFDLSGASPEIREERMRPQEFAPPSQPEMLDLFPLFLEACPSTISIKDRTARLVWANAAFLRLSHIESIDDIKGRTIDAILKLSPLDPVVLRDSHVIDHASLIYTQENLPNRPARRTMWFPIFSGDRVQFVGAVSHDHEIPYIPQKIANPARTTPL